MARIELNIVALGDFKSVDSQIKNLRAQVDLLNKSLTGTGLSSNLTKQLNDANTAFKASMLSTGQFTETTVKLKTETEKFGQALVSGKLKLSEYFSVIRGQSSAAAASMKALAIEQTKLQNSIITADPTKKGVFSVYTPTNIDAIANKTKIATNYQNLFNIAVDKGSQSLINWGKNTQWAGRQLTVGLTVPMAMFGSAAMKTFQQVNDELVRLQKVYGTGLTQPTAKVLDAIKAQVTGLSRELASTMGVSAKDTAAMAADLAATGKTGNDLLVATREAMRLSKLGELDTQSAMQATVSLQNVYKLSTQDLSKSIDFLNAVENQTSTSLQDLVAGIPRVGPIVQQLGGSFKDTAVMMVAMKEAGVPAAQSANAIKSALASLINPTKSAKDAFAAYNINLAGIASSTGGNPVQMIMQLQKALKGLAPLAQAQLIEKLFGKFQEARIQALITNLGAVNSQTKTAFDLVNASAPQLAAIAANEMKIATESTTGRFRRAVETIKADIIPLGQKIMEIATVLLKFGDSIAKSFGSLPSPVKSVLGILAGAAALVGPIVMLVGLMGNFAGYIMKTVFNLKNLITGTKTFGELFTPEMIASQNAADLFGSKILEDVGAVELLNQSVSQLLASLNGMNTAMSGGTGNGIVNVLGGSGKSMGTLKDEVGLYKAPSVFQNQTKNMQWSTLEAEQVAMRAAALKANPKLTEKQLTNLVQKQTSHMSPDTTSIDVNGKSVDIKNWQAHNLMADLGGINNYFDKNKRVFDNFEKNHLQAAAQKLGMSVDQVTAELNAMRAGIAPATRQSAAVLREVALTDAGYQGQAVAAGLKTRLRGNYYETLPQRSYNPGSNVGAAKSVRTKVARLINLDSGQNLGAYTTGGIVGKETAVVAEAAAAEGAIVAEKAAPEVVSKIGSRLGGMLKGGMGKGLIGLGVSMAANTLLPDNGIGGTAKNAVNMAATGAMIGSFIPGVGTAIGAVTGASFSLLTGGIHSLMAAEKEHAETAKSTFKVSSDAVDMFGGKITDQTIKMHKFAKEAVDSSINITKAQADAEKIKNLDSKTSDLKRVSNLIAGYNTSTSVIGTVRQFAAAQVANGMNPAGVKDMITAMLTYAGKTEYLSQALKEITKDTKDVSTATATWLQKAKQQAGYIDETVNSYSSLTNMQKNYADATLKVANTILNLNTSWSDAISTAKLLQDQVGNTTEAFKMLELAAKAAGDVDLSSLLTQLQNAGMSIENALLLARMLQVTPKAEGQSYIDYLKTSGKNYLESEANAATNRNKAKIAEYNQAIAKAKIAALADSKSALEVAKADLKIAEDKVKAEQKQTDELKKQQDYMASKTDLENQIRQAVATGNYLQANQLKQKLANTTNDYNGAAETPAQKEATRLQELVNKLQAEKDAADKKTNAVASVAKPVLEKVMSDKEINDIISGPNGLIAALQENSRALRGESKPGGDTVGPPAKTVGNKTLSDAAKQAGVGKQTQTYVPEGKSVDEAYWIFEWNGETYAVDKLTGTNVYKFDKNKNQLGTRIKDPSKVKTKAQAGSVSPGRYLVGEQGPEILDIPSYGHMIGASGTSNVLSRMSFRSPNASMNISGSALNGAASSIVNHYELGGIHIANVDSSVDIENAINDAFRKIATTQKMSGTITKIGGR